MADFSIFNSSPSLGSPDQDSSNLPSVSQVPSWMVAADNHNLGNSLGGSWFEPSTWGDKFQGAGKFVSVSILSGANSFYQTAQTVGNWFGAENEIRQTDSWISSLDSNLGEYYSQNRSAADLAGFIAGSLVPGLGGVKMLNVGQKALIAASEAGAVGSNLARATGILAPQTANYVKLASADIARTNASFSLLNQNALLALRNGTWQNVLEGLAFEGAVQATMFKSPVLENQDVGDIAKNLLIGGALSGVIGGAFEAARITTKLAAGRNAEDILSKPFTSKEAYAEALPPSSKAILSAAEREAAPVPIRVGTGEQSEAIYLKDRNNFLLTQEKRNNDIRTEVNKMVPGDNKEAGNLLADTLTVNPSRLLAGENAMPADKVMANLLHADQVVRVGQKTNVETELAAALKAGNLDALSTLAFRIVKVTGEDTGKVLDGTPVVKSLADTVMPRKGQSVGDAVLENVANRKISTKKLWNAADSVGPEAHLEAEARYIWWRGKGKEVLEGTKKPVLIHMNDIPALEVIRETGLLNKVLLTDGKTSFKIDSTQELYEHLKQTKLDVANDLLLKMSYEGKIPTTEGTDLISRIVNTRKKYLEGDQHLEDEVKDLFFRQSMNKAYAEARVAEGLDMKPGVYDTALIPEYVKISYRIPEELVKIDGNVIDGMVFLKTQEKMAQADVDRVAARYMGDLSVGLPTAEELTRLLPQANRGGGGPGLITFASGAYGSLESAMQQLGSVTQRLKIARKENAKDILNPALVALAQDTKGAIEFSNLNRIVSSTAEHYVYVDELAEYGFGEGPGLLARKLMKGAADDGLENAEVKLQPGAPESIPIVNETAANAVKAHVQANGRRVQAERDLRASQGKENYKDSNTFYPVRPNVKDFQHFAFVVDPRVTDVGHKSMIHAASERELNELIKQVQLKAPEYKVVTKDQAEAFYKAKGDYEFDRSLHDNYVDSDLRRKGVASEFFIKTDPQKIADETLNWHMRQEDVLAVELMRGKYQRQFDWLEDQAGAYSSLEASRYGATLDKVEKFEKNPYMSYVKAALDVSRASEYPLLSSVNRALDTAVSKVVGRVREIWNSAKSPADLDGINSALQESGYNNAYYDAALNLYANHTAPKGELTKFIRASNAILSRFTLGLDPMNALNNAIGANVLRGTELSYLTRALEASNPEAAGKLAELTKIALPTEQRALITSPAKLTAQAFKNFFSPESAALIERYKADGYIRNITEQFRSILDDFTLQGTETVGDLNSRIQRGFAKARELGDKGEKLTGNTFAEEFNRFVSADVMRQITDVAVDAGVISQREARAYINTFVNRVEGNIIASQRPLIFQGPIGQAVGLFQSYQFNLMQNLFRYVGEGRAKDVATLLGLQGTFYGLNGMPGFAFINQHIVGTASGNSSHRDLYDATYGIAGVEAGKFFLYGAPSYALQANLYTRGDINPRQVTILPTDLASVPFIGAYSKFASSLLDTAKKIGAGGSVVQSTLYGLEHNGISRPLAGIAQVLRAGVSDGTVFSTSNKGTMMGQNDLFSWSSAVRIAGAKPLDEAVMTDAMYRSRAYEVVDRGKKLNLAETVKVSVAGGGTLSSDQVSTFAEAYAAQGGKQDQFGKWMMNQYKAANTVQSEELAKQLKDPLSYKMQLLMGGSE
jgi:hypothetical protein